MDKDRYILIKAHFLDREKGKDGLREWGDRNQEEKKRARDNNKKAKKRERDIMMKQFVVTCISSLEQLL